MSDVRVALGPPTEEIPGVSDDAKHVGEVKLLVYPGLIVQLCKPEGALAFRVGSLQLLGAQHSFAGGLAVGITREDLVGAFGPPEYTAVDGGNGNERLHYSFCTYRGEFLAEVSENRVVEIELREYQW